MGRHNFNKARISSLAPFMAVSLEVPRRLPVIFSNDIEADPGIEYSLILPRNDRSTGEITGNSNSFDVLMLSKEGEYHGPFVVDLIHPGWLELYLSEESCAGPDFPTYPQYTFHVDIFGEIEQVVVRSPAASGRPVTREWIVREMAKRVVSSYTRLGKRKNNSDYLKHVLEKYFIDRIRLLAITYNFELNILVPILGYKPEDPW
ncbi:hypothetical protein CC1G_04837 [Coprinopsis cinerea okayama7|uniref:Uncharacterized protein n=1 Tax=Coprinopsis cinerea (strain Okayama-7 / 130 / ATCC MYA-4618 / FGSC 9003) TaxID=240176 RepID=A8PFR5_COPC7|nr:hypothetical protein CC1G_04837 [Coprinopsis cinerea okayama7\|eukprot:XP_001840993.1 hypothetical protein CC1G_04837 [Coprinopsis cinerea okayama7\